MKPNIQPVKIGAVINQAVLKLENHAYDKPKSYTLIYDGNPLLSEVSYAACSLYQGDLQSTHNNDLFKIIPNF